jgi:hypothetical protein
MATDNRDAELLEALKVLIACGLVDIVNDPARDEQRFRVDPARLELLSTGSLGRQPARTLVLP